MTDSNYAVLRVFRGLFEGRPYLHRDSSLGDRVASYLYEDLYNLGKSTKLRERIETRSRVLNVQNLTVGILRRRGDGILSASERSWVALGYRVRTNLAQTQLQSFPSRAAGVRSFPQDTLVTSDGDMGGKG